MWLAAIVLIATQETTPWRARAHSLEVQREHDRALLAYARSLVDVDDTQVRRELARLAEERAALRLTLRLPGGAEPRGTPFLSAAAGRIATAWNDVRVWDERTGALVAEPIPTDAIEAHLDPTGQRIVIVAAHSGRAELWSLAPPERIAVLGDGSGPTVWSPDGKLVARPIDVGEETHPCVWDALTGEVVLECEPAAHSSPDLALSADGTLAVNDGTVALYDVRSGARIAEGLPGGDAPMKFHPTAPRIMLHDGERGTMRAFDVPSRAWHGPELIGLTYVAQLASDTTGARWVASFTDRAVASLEDGSPAGLPLEADTLEDEWRSKYGAEAHALAPDGSLQAVSGLGGTVRVWDTRSGRRLGPALVHGSEVTAIKFTAAGELVSASDDGVVRIWATEELAPVEVACERWAHRVYLARGGTRALVLQKMCTLELLEPDGRARWRRDVPVSLDELTISRDGGRMAGANTWHGLWFWDPRAADPAIERVSAIPWVGLVALDTTGRSVAAADRETVRVWDLTRGALRAQFTRPSVGAESWLAFDARDRLWELGYSGVGPLGEPSPDRSSFAEPDELQALALDSFGEAHMFGAALDEDVTWRSGDRVAASLELVTGSTQLGEVRSWRCSATRVVAVHDDGATLIDPVSRKVVAELDDTGDLDFGVLVGDRLALVGEHGIGLFDAGDGARLALHPLKDWVWTVCPLPGTAQVVVSSSREELFVVDTSTSARVGPPIDSTGEPTCVAMVGRAEALVATARGAILHVSLDDGKTRELLPSRGKTILHMERSPDATRLVYVEDPDVVVLHDLTHDRTIYDRELAPGLTTAKPLIAGTTFGDDPLALQFDPTGKWLLVASHILYYVGNGGYNHEPAEAEIVDATTGRVTAVLEDCDGMVQNARFSADGERLVAWKWRELITWETRTGRLLARVSVDELIEDVRFIAAEHAVVAVDQQGGFGVWEADSGAPRSAVRRLVDERFPRTRLSPDGRYLFQSRGAGDGHWLDLVKGEEWGAGDQPAPAFFGPDGLVVLQGGLLARLTPDGLVRLGVRRWIPSNTDYELFRESASTAFIDTTHVVMGAYLSGVQLVFDLADFGPASSSPAVGHPAELLASWCTRLGLQVDGAGEIVPRDGR